MSFSHELCALFSLSENWMGERKKRKEQRGESPFSDGENSRRREEVSCVCFQIERSFRRVVPVPVLAKAAEEKRTEREPKEKRKRSERKRRAAQRRLSAGLLASMGLGSWRLAKEPKRSCLACQGYKGHLPSYHQSMNAHVIQSHKREVLHFLLACFARLAGHPELCCCRFAPAGRARGARRARGEFAAFLAAPAWAWSWAWVPPNPGSPAQIRVIRVIRGCSSPMSCPVAIVAPVSTA